ncbi:MAG: amidohydrolase family protein [Actinomycetota bacterium]
MSERRIIDPHVHYWDPYTTPRQVTPLVKLFGRWPRVLDRVGRLLTPTPLVDFVGDPVHALNPHLPADLQASAGRHPVEGIVHVEAGWEGKGPLGPVGETEWLDGLDDPPLAIVGHATLDDPRSLVTQLDAHAAASPRLRGIRDMLSAHPDKRIHSWTDAGRIAGDGLRDGLRRLAERSLTFEAWVYGNQLGELATLAADVPEATIVLDHLGTPVAVAGPYGGHGEAATQRSRTLEEWQAGLEAVAGHPNVYCKLSGLLMPICGFGFHERPDKPSVGEVADALGPYLTFGIETFGAERCMLASNFPMDKVSVDYEVLWEAFVQIVANAGLDEAQQAGLLADNAAAFYRLDR